jgi:iron(III) transport system ATP-binding protein
VAEALRLDSVGKTFRNGTVALDDVSLAADPGTFLVLLGPSGSGKTTLLRSVAGIEKISTGEIVIGDKVVAKPSFHLLPERRGLSMVFQDYALWPHLCAAENVAFALKRTGMPARQRRAEAERMLERVGLGALAERYPSELSGGEQQRVALARALVGDAALVLCDEPLSNLDADLRERMRVQISELVRASESTAVYITHDQAEAFALADRVGVLEKGRLVQLGTPEEIYSHPASPFVARFTGVAAELPVSIRRRAPSGGAVEVALLETTATRPVVGEAGALLERGRGALLVRPAATRLTAADSAERHVAGKVVDVAFRGRGYEVAVALPDGLKVSAVLTAERVERGAIVGLEFAPGGCVVFGEADAAATDTDFDAEPRAEQRGDHSLPVPVPVRVAPLALTGER